MERGVRGVAQGISGARLQGLVDSTGQRGTALRSLCMK